MFRVRKELIDTFSESMETDYHRGLTAFFRAVAPEATARYVDEALLQLIAQSCRKADTYGVKTGQALVRFIAIALLVSPEFDASPTAQHYLTDPGLDSDSKVHLLADLIAKRLQRKNV
jgi:hypothetical protein